MDIKVKQTFAKGILIEDQKVLQLLERDKYYIKDSR